LADTVSRAEPWNVCPGRKTGLVAPDRADGALLALYEPVSVLDERRYGLLN
jgi:hypothetical protein